MGLKERLLDFISYKELDIAVFERITGLSNGAVHKMGNGTREMTIDKISGSFPDLNTAWLKTGIGEMIKGTERTNITVSVPQSSISEDVRKGALIYNIDGTCGTDGRALEFSNEKIIGSIDTPEINPNSQIIFASGDSMHPLIYSGDRIVVRKIESWEFFNYGQVYLIITNEYRLIKRIRKHPTDEENTIVLRSENNNYDDINLPRKEILYLYLVENILAIKNL